MKLDMVGIVVADINQALKFYEIIGLKAVGVQMDTYVEIGNDSLRISLNSIEMIAGIYGYTPSLVGDRIELAFLCETNEELEDLVSKVRVAGFEVFKEPWNAPWGQYYSIVKDVDGNMISLFTNSIKES